MPFERYLRDDHVNENRDLSYYYQDHKHAYDGLDCQFVQSQHSSLPELAHHNYHHPHAIQFQIPQFMLNGPPILAPGGGAEVFPPGLLDSGPESFASTWFANNGFAPFHSALVSRQAPSGLTPSEDVTAPSYHVLPPFGSQGLLPSFSPRFPANDNSGKKPLPESPPSTAPYASDISSIHPPAPLSDAASYEASNILISDPISSPPATAPSALGLPMYSTSGFDILPILARVQNRPNPTVQLGPVDLSCSFVVVDVRRYDCPIVYASPTFCHLTGYSEQEVLGRNCRFLQSPTGSVAKGEPRRFVSPESVSYLRKSLSSSKECQTSLINYRKGGQAFINLVTVIPLRGGVHNTPEEADEVAYHVGFQVDLTDQPIRILDKLRDGSYHYANTISWEASSVAGNAGLPSMCHSLDRLVQAQNMSNIGPKVGRYGHNMSVAVSEDLKNLIADPTFTDAVPISTATNVWGATSTSIGSREQGIRTSLTTLVTPPSSATMNRVPACGGTTTGSIPISLSPSLSLLLLEFLPDFLLVLSLKGAFLYVAPSVRLVLGYEPQELVGRSISDICHPADLVPLMRELKEGSVSGFNISGTGDVGSSTVIPPNLLPKSVDLLFRALPKASMPSPLGKTSVSVGQSDVHPSHSLSSSTFQSTLSPGTLSSNNSSGETIPPYIWLECRGRLHVEPGKGRKAIILSGRARWMPVVRWGSIIKASGIDGMRYQRKDSQGDLCMTAGSVDPLEFWALLSLQGTFLVASASVRDVLGWGSSEVIGRNIWGMSRDNMSGMRECVEAELTKMVATETRMVDPPPTVVTMRLLHKEMHTVHVRLVFYRTPQPPTPAPQSTSFIDAIPASIIHQRNSPLYPIVCQATVLSDVKYGSNNNLDGGTCPSFNQVQSPADETDDADNAGPSIDSSSTSIFEELETSRGSSWQYELQQLKFANQRLHEELSALEGACASGGRVAGPSSDAIEMRPIVTVPLGHPCLSSSPIAVVSTSQQPPLPPTQSRYSSSMSSTLPASLPSIRLPNSLHEQEPPSSEWSSLAGANGQCLNPLKRSWRSDDGQIT